MPDRVIVWNEQVVMRPAVVRRPDDDVVIELVPRTGRLLRIDQCTGAATVRRDDTGETIELPRGTWSLLRR